MQISKRGTIVAAVLVVVAITLFGLKAWSPWNNGSELGAFAAPANAKPMALGDLGPGVCWPRDERPSGVKNPKAGFAEPNGPTKAAAWFRNPPKDRAQETKGQLDNYDIWLDQHKGYYLVTEVVPEWNQWSKTQAEKHKRVIAYISKMKAMQLEQQMRVQNTHCDNKQGKVTPFEENHVLPVKEWIFFVPGHEPGSEDPRPAFKAVCGNPLLPPHKEVKPEARPTTQPPTTSPSTPPGCKPGDCTTPPPCGPEACTTTPPPGGKKAPHAPGNGGEGDGGDSQHGGPGSDRQRVNEPVSPPKAGDPPSERDDPPPPKADPPPGGNPAPSRPAPPPATGAPAPTAAPTQCVNPPGMNVCD